MSETTMFRIDATRNPILANLPAKAQMDLLLQGERALYEPGMFLVHEGDPSDFLIFVVAGEVAILKGGVEIDRQSAGGVLGEMGVLTNQPRTASVRCVTRVEAWKVSAEAFLRMLEGYPQMLRSFIHDLVHKFEASQVTRVRMANNLQRATDILSRCVSTEVLENILQTRTPEELLDGRQEEAAILFFDIRGFTRHAEITPPQLLLRALNEHLALIVTAVARHGGTIVNFIGDAVLAVFNTPVPLAQPAVAALNCYLQCRYELRELHGRRRLENQICFQLGAGLNYGVVVAGAIGSENRFSYNVLGDQVNLAARLEGLTRHYPVEIILSATAWQQLTPELRNQCLLLDRAQVKGRQQAENLYTLGDLTELERPRYESAMAAYLSGRFAEAAGQFSALDGFELAGFFARRCQYLLTLPAAEWPGYYGWSEK